MAGLRVALGASAHADIVESDGGTSTGWDWARAPLATEQPALFGRFDTDTSVFMDYLSECEVTYTDVTCESDWYMRFRFVDGLDDLLEELGLTDAGHQSYVQLLLSLQEKESAGKGHRGAKRDAGDVNGAIAGWSFFSAFVGIGVGVAGVFVVQQYKAAAGGGSSYARREGGYAFFNLEPSLSAELTPGAQEL